MIATGHVVQPKGLSACSPQMSAFARHHNAHRQSNANRRSSAGYTHVAWRQPVARAVAGEVQVEIKPQQPKAPEPWRWEDSEDAVKAYGALLGMLGLGLIPALQTSKLADLPYFIGLASITIYIGAHKALTTRSRQQISIKEGALAPVFASISLFGLYLLLKYFPDLSIQTVLNAYFFLLGNFAIMGAGGPLLRQVCGPLGQTSIKLDVPEGWLVEEDGSSMTKLELAPSDFLALALSLGISGHYLQGGWQDYTTNNLIACLIATDILQLIGLRSFRTAGLLLAGLLVYDVFWVFMSPQVVGENVMLTVATSEAVTGPTRLLFPRMPGGTGEASAFPFSLLGLGDVAIPGLLACLALRYDASRATDMKGRAVAAAGAIAAAIRDLQPGATGTEIANATASAAEAAYDNFADRELKQRNNTTDGTNDRAGSVPAALAATSNAGATERASRSETQPVAVSEAVLEQRNYFSPVMAAYVVGLLIAFGANTITSMGQPALLYLCPCTLGAVALTAASRSELQRVWTFTDVPSFGVPEKDKDKKKQD